MLRLNLSFLFSYPTPVCFLPDITITDNLNPETASDIESFINNTKSKNVLVILDQVEISFDLFEKCCNDKNLILKFASDSIKYQNNTKIFDFCIPFDPSEYADTSLIYIGPHEKLANDFGCIFHNHESLRINSLSFSLFQGSISRELTKSCALIDSISNFDHVGIIVENPNVRLHVQTAHYLQNICSANDIIADIVYVGRLNEMKLGNFPDIEFFILLSCTGRASFHFVKPIVSPLEFICAKFEVNFWENQILRDLAIFLEFCDKHQNMLLNGMNDDSSLDGQLVIKSFFELSTQLVNLRRNYSYNGLEINSSNKEIKLHKGATGNSTSYDYESNK